MPLRDAESAGRNEAEYESPHLVIINHKKYKKTADLVWFPRKTRLWLLRLEVFDMFYCFSMSLVFGGSCLKENKFPTH